MRMSPINNKTTNTVKAVYPQQFAIGFQSYFTKSSSSLTTTTFGFQGGVLSRAPNTILSRNFTTISITLLQFSFIYESLQFSVTFFKNKNFFSNFPIAQAMAQLVIPSTFLLLAWQYFWKARACPISDSRPTSSSGIIYRPQSSPPPRQKRKALSTNSFENLRQYSQDTSGLPGSAEGGVAATAKQGFRKDLTILLAGVGTLRQDVDSPKDQFLIFLDIILKIIISLLYQDTKQKLVLAYDRQMIKKRAKE